MANIIDINGDRSLQLSGSEAFYRKMDLPSGSTDIRFGLLTSLVSGSTPLGQSFSPAVSVFETVMAGFTSNTGSIPLYTPGISCVIMRSASCRTSDARSYSTLTSVPANSASIIQGYGGWESQDNSLGTGSFPNASGSVTVGVNGVPVSLNLFSSWISDKLAPFIIRAYKSGTTNIIVESRAPNSYNVNTYTSRTPSQNESYLRDCLTNVSSTTQGHSVIFGFANQTERDNAFSQLNTVFFGWPFYNVALNIECMGYRAV